MKTSKIVFPYKYTNHLFNKERQRKPTAFENGSSISFKFEFNDVVDAGQEVTTIYSGELIRTEEQYHVMINLLKHELTQLQSQYEQMLTFELEKKMKAVR